MTIDFDQVFCPLGCCRMVGHVLNSLRGLRKKKAFTMMISGELKEGEKQMVLGWLKSSGQAVDDGSVIEQFEDREDEEEDEEDDEEEDEDDEDDEDDDDEEEEYGEEDDDAGISSTDTVGSHSGDSEDSLETSDTDGTEFQESSSAFSKEPVET